MSELDILAIGRAERYSPNSVEKDAAVLEGVCRLLTNEGLKVHIVSEEKEAWETEAKAYISMGRLPRTLEHLQRQEREGKVVINKSDGVSLCCNRKMLNERLASIGIPLPLEDGTKGYWLKRATGVAESSADVQFVADKEEMLLKREQMREQGIETIVQAHIDGDLVKFYGVVGEGFFRTYYPCDDGQWKFDDERRNGKPCHYDFSMAELQQMAEKAATAAGISIYGGDCIITSEGQPVLIDLNDWPSFSRCREEAAMAISRHIINNV